MSADGARFVAITDESHWVTGRLEYAAGNLAAATGETIAPMLDLDGNAMSDKAGDAEGLAPTTVDGFAGDLIVSFEGEHRLWRYPFGREGVAARPVALPLPSEAGSAPRNGGIEAITLVDEGLLLAVSERQRDRAGDFRAWLLPVDRDNGSGQPSPGLDALSPLRPDELEREKALALRPLSPFVVTDGRRLHGGDVLLLERRFDPVGGVGARLRRIPTTALAAARRAQSGAPLDGEIVAELDADYEIDNFEALAVRQGPAGETLVYLASDDNFRRPLQRTLFLMFELSR